MTTETQNVDNNDVDNSTAGGDQPTVEQLQAELAEARAEAAKLKGIKAKLVLERDSLKKAPAKNESTEEDYKSLWDDANQKLTKMQEAVKSSQKESALRERLLATKVHADKVDAALKLADLNMVEWDEDSGIDKTSVTAAVQKLKGAYGWLFESKVAGTPEPKSPSEGSSSDKTISRAEFERLNPEQKRDKIVTQKFKVVD